MSPVQPDKVQLGLGLGTFKTTIRFDGDRDVDVDMSTVSFAGAWLINENWTLRGGMGVILGGELKPQAEVAHKIDTGGLAAIGVERRVLVGGGSTPFIDLSLFLGASWTKTLDPNTQIKTSYFATDLRFGARAGWNINGNTFPYVAARVFGGPVNWELEGEDVTGSDIHHYQMALGTAVQLGPMGFYAEWAGLGEKAVSAGISTSW